MANIIFNNLKKGPPKGKILKISNIIIEQWKEHSKILRSKVKWSSQFWKKLMRNRWKKIILIIIMKNYKKSMI